MNKRPILAIKVVVLLAVLGFLAYKLNEAWKNVATMLPLRPGVYYVGKGGISGDSVSFINLAAYACTVALSWLSPLFFQFPPVRHRDRAAMAILRCPGFLP